MSRPRTAVLLAYRLLGWRVGPHYRDWVLDDIVRPGWLLRQGLLVLSAVLALGSVLCAAVGADGSRLVPLLVVLAGAGAFLRTSLRERALRQQGIDASGNRLPDAGWYDDDHARRRRNLIGGVSTVVLVVAGLLLLALRSR